MQRKISAPSFLSIDELSPSVDVASCYQIARNERFYYRLPAHHMMLIESGKIEFKTPGRVLHGAAGDLFCLRPTERNEYRILEPALLYQAHIWFSPPPRFQATPAFGEFGPMPIKMSLGHAFPEMRSVFETICIEIIQAGPVHQLRVRAAIHEMLAITAGLLMRDYDGVPRLDGWQRLRLRLETRPNADFRVESMARQMNLSRSHFNHAFKQRFGVTPKAYHTHARLREAVRLLRDTDKPVKSVAYELGFRDSRAFTRLFKNQLGVLPSDIRRGMASAPRETPQVGDKFFPMNKSLVPPLTPPNWKEQFVVK